MLRVEVLNQYERHSRIRRQFPHQFRESLDASG